MFNFHSRSCIVYNNDDNYAEDKFLKEEKITIFS